jgi:hypothetical protein
VQYYLWLILSFYGRPQVLSSVFHLPGFQTHLLPGFQTHLASVGEHVLSPSRLDVRRTNATATMAEGAYDTGLVATQLLHRRRGHGHLMQVKMG